MIILRLPVVLLLLAVTTSLPLALGTAHAQNESESGELTEKELTAMYGKLKSQRYYRNAPALYDNILRFAQTDPDRITPADQFVRAFYEGRWDEIRDTLDRLPDALADGIFDKILSDMAGRYVPVLTLDDFIGLSNACPSELTSDRIRKLGILLRAAVPPEQEVWLKEMLQKGTRHLGRNGPKRMDTGRVLLHANFDELAQQYLPNTLESSQIEDAAIRNEILQFLASQEELEQFQQTQLADLWEQQADVLTAPLAETSKKRVAADRLAELLGRAEAVAVEPWLRRMTRTDANATLELALALGKQTQGKTNDRNTAMRTHNLKAQQVLLKCAGEQADLTVPPWDAVAAAMADCWVREAEHTFDVHPSYRSGPQKPCVAPGDLLDSAPQGAWADALPAAFGEQIDLCLAQAVLVSDRYQDAVPRIVALAKRNPAAGVAMAEEYLKAWADRHDPEVPEAIRKKFGLADDARIAVTPIMMEKNIVGLAEMMDLFRKNNIRPRNAELLVGAFDVCYSDAEAYKKSHIEKVFGPIDKMDEDIFYHIVRTMTRGLSSRWRSIEVQKESGTQRSQEETLDMVRRGYQTALDMIDQRTRAGHDKAWKVLALAGSLASDWGDFDYYQQLVSDSSTNRMEAFREKNNLAQAYFARAADAYASQVEQLKPAQYSIDVYLAWFHSLLGINSGGSLNLSKPLDRQALERLRDTMRQIPADAGTKHIDMFAKHVSARMEDIENPLHEELKYKYLAGSLIVTKDSPFSFQASDKVSYYDQLLDEIRLETRVDGPSTIYREHEFGIILSVYHTEAMGRMATFGKYLTNELPPTRPPGRSAPQIVTTYKIGEAQGRRDELEMNIREALGLFFDVETVVFSPKDVQPRPTERAGWEETVLAYIHTQAKDASVDKIPRIQMSLEFLDLTGPVSVSAESAETMIKVTDQPTPPRPFGQVDMTQTLDARNLQTDEEVILEITTTASGLVPELPTLLDLDALQQQLPIARIDPHGGNLVREINSWGDTVHAVSERRWTIALDATSLVDPPQSIQLQLPAPKVESAVSYQAFSDMDLVDLDEPAARIGEGPAAASPTELAQSIDIRLLYAGAAAAALLGLVLLAVILRLLLGSRQRPLRARDVFHMPQEIDSFVVIQLLRALDSSSLVRLSPVRRSEMRHDIQRIQASCFSGNGHSEISENELRQVAQRWLKIAC